ncbi:MAG: hypothetical protein U1E67_12720 [Hyphomicrobiales bacterium]
MIAEFSRAFDNLFGRGEAAVTVPPLDGALRPNRALDEAAARFPLAGVDSLAVVLGELLASCGAAIHRFDKGHWRKRSEYDSEILSLASIGEGGLAIALATGEIAVKGGHFEGRLYKHQSLACITALAGTGAQLYLANGSAKNGPADWQRDLLERNASGSVWRLDLESGTFTRLAEGLAWPAGLALDPEGPVFSEAWKHQLVRIDSTGLKVLYADLPAYPCRIAPATDGYWLALFAPRSQLVEFVLREPAYRKRMMAEVPQAFWVAPKLRSGRSFYESLQGGGVKHLGLLKPWAPTMSAGLCVKLDLAFQPRASLQSRADGRTHGVTGITEHDGQIFVAARGDGIVVSLPGTTLGGTQA